MCVCIIAFLIFIWAQGLLQTVFCRSCGKYSPEHSQLDNLWSSKGLKKHQEKKTFQQAYWLLHRRLRERNHYFIFFFFKASLFPVASKRQTTVFFYFQTVGVQNTESSLDSSLPVSWRSRGISTGQLHSARDSVLSLVFACHRQPPLSFQNRSNKKERTRSFRRVENGSARKFPCGWGNSIWRGTRVNGLLKDDRWVQ